ncbi:MAG: hypothetical protein AAGE65_01550 [Planctomycetota bacterium]
MRRTTPALAALLALLVFPAAGQTNFALLTSPWDAAGPIDQVAGYLFIPTETDSPDSADLDLNILRTGGRFRPDRESPQKLTFAYELTHLDLGTSDPLLPERLNDVAVAGGMILGQFEAFDNRWQWGGSVGFGHASTNPFGDGSGWYALGSAFASTRLSPTTGLTLGVDFDGNRTVFPDIPLPALVYSNRLSEQFTFVVGFPLNRIVYTPSDRWTFIVAAAGIAFEADAFYKLTDSVTLFAKYGGDTDGFQLADEDSDERLFFSAQIIEGGVQYTFDTGVTFSVSGGLAFDQEFEQGFDLRDTDNVRDLDDAGFVRVAGRIEF